MDNKKYLNMVKRYWWMLDTVPFEIQTDEVIDAAMERNIWAFEYIKNESKKTYERCLKAVDGCGLLLQHVPKKMQTDEIIDESIKDYPWAFMYIKDENKKTLDRCMYAVSRSGRMFKYVPDDLKERV
ncbi:MAG: DUF4116 domain-containing protein, partial [Sulfurovum sp.]|nr:DUF4116 domain-containing protein [Sulfurovum sp.]